MRGIRFECEREMNAPIRTMPGKHPHATLFRGAACRDTHPPQAGWLCEASIASRCDACLDMKRIRLNQFLMQ
jgi:hypothetical protein